LEIEPSERLYEYARKWLKQFPQDQDAPALVAAWLAAFPSSDVELLCEHYLEFADCNDIWPLIRVIFQTGQQPPEKFQELIASRLECEPRSDTWPRSLATPKLNLEVANKLAVRWLELNACEPRTHILSLCTFVQSSEVMEALLLWMKRNSDGLLEEFAMSLAHLTEAAAKHHPELLPELIAFSRMWLCANSNSPRAGNVHCELIRTTHNLNDIEKAKKWYQENRGADTAWYVLSALLFKQNPDNFAVNESKRVLKSQPADKRIPALTGRLLRAVRDDETVRLARELCITNPVPWILEELLAFASDDELVGKAHGLLEKWDNHEAGHTMLLALLNAAPQNEKTQKLAESWLESNKDHDAATQIRALLRT